MYKKIKNYSEMNEDTNLEKVGLFVVGHESPTYIRLLSTFDFLSDSFDVYLIDVTKEEEIDKVFNDLKNDSCLLDIIIVQRDAFISQEFITLLFKKSKLLRIKVIYEIDDDLLNIDKSHKAYNYYSKKQPCIRYLIKNANIVTVSTENLKNKLCGLNNNIFVVPNVLTDDWNVKVNKRSHSSDIIKIGYMGTHSHKEDLKLIKDVIIHLKEYFLNKKNKKIIFELIGGTVDKLDWADKLPIPKDSTLYPDFVKFLKQTDWDIAIAPLEDNNINSSKSPLKYIEYSGLGVPGVYSDIGPYKECIRDGENGLLVQDNDVENWKNNIIKLIENKNLRLEIVENAKTDIDENFSNKKAISCWKSILNLAKRDKNLMVYKLWEDYRKSNLGISFIDFLQKNSYNIIKDSGLFDEKWYLNEYEDVKQYDGDPINHFLKLGYYEKCNPSELINLDDYEIEKSFITKDINKLIFYILYLN